jgi:hypothetical protein
MMPPGLDSVFQLLKDVVCHSSLASVFHLFCGNLEKAAISARFA